MSDQIISYEYGDSYEVKDELSYQIQKLINSDNLSPFLDNGQFFSFIDATSTPSECTKDRYFDAQGLKGTLQHISYKNDIQSEVEYTISKNLRIQNLLHQYYHKLESDLKITIDLSKKLQKATKSLISKQRKSKNPKNFSYNHITKHLIGWNSDHPQRQWSWFIDVFEYVTPPPTLDSLQRQNRHSKYKTSIQIPTTTKWTNKEKKMLSKLVERSINYIPASTIATCDNMNLWENVLSVFSCSDFPRRHFLEYRNQWSVMNRNIFTPWSKNEESLLTSLVKNTNRNWMLVSGLLSSNRTASECFKQYRETSTKTHQVRVKWTKKEDEQLLKVVSLYGEGDWQQVSSVMPEGRTGQQCMSRWTKSINPSIHHGKWTKEEDEILIAIMNVFDSPHNDSRQMKRWALVSQFVPNRTDVQCRERWMNKLDPSLNEGNWTKEEDEKLLELVSQHGPSKWSWFSRHSQFVRRTDNQLRRRYRMMTQKKSI